MKAEEFYQLKNGGKSSEEAFNDSEWISPIYAVMLMEEYANAEVERRIAERMPTELELIDRYEDILSGKMKCADFIEWINKR